MSERFGKLHRAKARLDIQSQILGDIIRGLSGPRSEAVEHIQIVGHHRFNSEATLLLKAATRGQAINYLGMFPPAGLDMVELRDGGRAIVPTLTRMGTVVRKREVIVPFTYSVVQVRKKARHSVVWVHILPVGPNVTIECDIEEDRAELKLEHLDDQAHNQVLFRRMPNNWVPDGPRIELRGLEWSTVKDVPASLTVWWPWTHPKIAVRRHGGNIMAQVGLRGDKDWPHGNVEELAEELLEVRQEAHG